MKNVFYFILKDLFVIKIFKFSFGLFGRAENNYNTHITQHAQRIQVPLELRLMNGSAAISLP